MTNRPRSGQRRLRSVAAPATVASELESALQSTPLLPRDQAAAQLARRYAALVDQLFVRLSEPEATESPTHHRRVISEIDTAGRRLEAMLDRLGMAPGSRPAATGAGEGKDPRDELLDRLRADAASRDPSRVDYAAAVDPAVTAADAAD